MRILRQVSFCIPAIPTLWLGEHDIVMDLLPAQPPNDRPRLRDVQHPDMSTLITHFCDRARPQAVPNNIRALDGAGRLGSILWEARLRAFITYSGGDPAVCFTEATIKGLEFLIGERFYQPWGLVFDRQSVYDVGGGPVWYARAEEYYQIRTAGPRAQAWAVKLEAGSSDWLEEREWRVPVDAPRVQLDGSSPTLQPEVPLSRLRIVALLVGDQSWSPLRQDWRPTPTGTDFGPALPSLLAGVDRWWWDREARNLWQLPPLL